MHCTDTRQFDEIEMERNNDMYSGYGNNFVDNCKEYQKFMTRLITDWKHPKNEGFVKDKYVLKN